MRLTNHLELLYNPFGNDAINDAMRIISVSSQNTTRYFTSLDLSTDLKGLENNNPPDVYYSYSDGGFMIGGTTKDKMVVNGTTRRKFKKGRSLHMSAPRSTNVTVTSWYLGSQNDLWKSTNLFAGECSRSEICWFSQNVENGYNVFLVSTNEIAIVVQVLDHKSVYIKLRVCN